MKSKVFAYCLIGLAFGGCQDAEYTDPSDDPTGKAPPEPTEIFRYEAADSPRFLNANLEASNLLQAEFTVVQDGSASWLVPAQAGGALPGSAGADADLLAGVGFGTYPNPDRGAADWTEGSFKSVLKADVKLNNPGDAVKFCRSFGTTCVTAQMNADGSGLIVLNLAANVPDTEIGEIADGVSASIRGTGENGLTIAVTDPTVVARPFTVTAGTPFTLEWTIARGPITGLPPGAGSISYSVSVDDTELASGDTLSALAGSIPKTGGVAMIFDQPVTANPLGQVDYSYSFQGRTGDFTDPFDVPNASIDLSPQFGLGAAPLYLYPTLNPGIELLTLGGDTALAHPVQAADAVLGGIIEPPGSAPQTRVYSTGFDGDDFADTGLAGLIDQGITGGGFYPSPAFCYAQVYPQVDAQVRAGVRKEVHRQMYAAIANGIAAADAGLEQLAAGLNQGGASLTYTRLGDVAAGNIENYILIGTDYADSNVDTNITTEVDDTYTVMLNQTVSQTFRDQLVAIITTGEAADFFDPTDPTYQALKRLQVGLTAPNGIKNGKLDQDGDPVEDDPPDVCAGYDCNVAVILADKINGTNISGQNDPVPPSDEIPPPVLAHACIWGLPAAPAQDATDAVLSGNLAT
ncbi:MAG TPA: hypothetical protein VNM90_19210, partial [Haliangium sp.]|nr:hypothetical protein [Haliangium sp.]